MAKSSVQTVSERFSITIARQYSARCGVCDRLIGLPDQDREVVLARAREHAGQHREQLARAVPVPLGALNGKGEEKPIIVGAEDDALSEPVA